MILMKVYKDVFAWNYENMPGLDPQVVMHRLNIKPDIKPVKQERRDFALISWRLLKRKFRNSSHVVSYGKSNIRIELPTLSPFLKRIKKSGFVSITVISTPPVLKMSFHCPSLMS